MQDKLMRMYVISPCWGGGGGRVNAIQRKADKITNTPSNSDKDADSIKQRT